MSGIDKKQLKHDPFAEWIVHELAQLKPYRRQIAGGAILVALVIIGVVWYAQKKASRPEQASFALATVQQPADLQRIVTEYSDTASAPAALMVMGRRAAEVTNYTQAASCFSEVVNSYPESFLYPAAVRALAKCYVAQGEYARAKDLLKREVLYDKTSYVAPLAQLDLVRILCAMERYEEAWNELQTWDQMMGQSRMAAAAFGLREKLLRVTGISTNQMATQNYDAPVL